MGKLKGFTNIGLVAIFSLFLSHCGGIRTIENSRLKRDHLYSAKFQKRIRKVKYFYSLGQLREALDELQDLEKKGQLQPTEVALMNNLFGVIYFSKGLYPGSIKYFHKALNTSTLDLILTSKIKLNLGSTYYKTEKFIRAYSALKTVDDRQLVGADRTKYFRLFFILAKQLGDKDDALKGLIKFLGQHKTLAKIKESHHFDFLIHQFSLLSRREKVRLLEGYVEDQNLAAGYLGFIEVEKLLYEGERERALDLLEWLDENFSKRDELQVLIASFEGRVEKLSKIRPNAIGVILPFSGGRKEFAHRAMLGIDFAVQRLKQDYKDIKIYTTDSEGNSLMGRRRVKELIEKHSVSFIVGGLFSDEAKEEYLEARKYGVMFVSLSQIFMPRKEKGFLLLEVSGSVESQIRRVLSPDILGEFGKKIAVIYSHSERGKAYINELWTQTLGGDTQIVGVQSYPRGTKDFRDPVANMLGLKYPRFRQEELDFMKDVFALERSKVRRIQTLPPIIDFDWVYLPAYPQDAIQVIPSFSYYDADKLSFIGGPSWRSRILNKVTTRGVYFIGDGIDQVEKSILNKFIAQYKTRPRLIEINALEAFTLGKKLLFSGRYDRRAYNGKIKNMGILEGLTGEFRLLDGLWIKEMHLFRIRRGKANRVNLANQQ